MFDKIQLKENQSEQRSVFTDNPDQMIREAIQEVRFNQKINKTTIGSNLNNNTIQDRWQSLRAQTDLEYTQRGPFQDQNNLSHINSPTGTDVFKSNRPSL